MAKPKPLMALQPSNVAVVEMGSTLKGQRYWFYYTTSFGTHYDPRHFRSRDLAVSAAYAAGFKVK